jgi:tRNA modification GTPase
MSVPRSNRSSPPGAVTERAGRSGLPGPAPDTIVARATPPGVSALAVVRISGQNAADHLRVLGGECPLPPPRRATLLPLLDPATGDLLDRCLVTFFPGPGSYTGEDLVEISCHGGWQVPARVVEACVTAGARAAEPGEFTRRAVLNGKMDLLQAEGVLDLIEGRSAALHRTAVHQVERGLSRRISELRELLVQLEALLMHHIDFPEEDEPPVPMEQVLSEGGSVLSALEALLATAPEGELLREGALTVLAGRPNSGKSSLYNALLGEERAIVTEVPGTTRDALEAVVGMGGFPFRLVDTAGLRGSSERIERLGIEVAERYVEVADAILYCAELNPGIVEADLEFLRGLGDRPVVVALTKADLHPGLEPGLPDGLEDARAVRISAMSGLGLDALRKSMTELVYSGLVDIRDDAPVLTRERHRRSAADHLRAFLDSLSRGVPAEMSSTHLRPAETALEELLGVISTDDVLDRVFSEFCVGK